jgi:hypothetical protein
MPTQFDQRQLKAFGVVQSPLVLGDQIKHQKKPMLIAFITQALADFDPTQDHLLLCGHGFGTLLCTAIILNRHGTCPVLVFDNRRKEFFGHTLNREDLNHE